MDIQISLAFLFSAYLLPVFVFPCVFQSLKICITEESQIKQHDNVSWDLSRADSLCPRGSWEVQRCLGDRGPARRVTGKHRSRHKHVGPSGKSGRRCMTGTVWRQSLHGQSTEAITLKTEDSEVTTMKNYTVMLKPTCLCGILSVKLKKKI